MAEYLRHRKLATLAIVLGLGAAACSPKEPASCLSPRAISEEYEGDSSVDPGDQSTWTTGIEVETKLPGDVLGLVVGFTSAGRNDWRNSQPVPKGQADSIALRIGAGDVEFSTQIQARKGSEACNDRPDSTFGEPETYRDIIKSGAVAPEWPED